MKKGLVIGLALILGLGLAAMAYTVSHVEWSSPDPDIYVARITTYPTWDNAWASVTGSGGTASGEIEVKEGHYHDLTNAWQTATFEGGSYAAAVGASRLDYNSTIHSFNVQGAVSSWVEQQAGSMPSYAQVQGWQTYSAEGADLVIAGGSVDRDHWTWNIPQDVTFTGNAEGDVTGSQRSWTNCMASGEEWNSPGLGFGAGISGTEGTTYFDFVINTPDSIRGGSPYPSDPNPGTLHTVVIGSFGESHTWLETSVLDDDFNWIESGP